MSRTGFRAVIVSAAAALALIGAEAAQACSYLGITAGPSPAGAGDQVTWTIGGIEEGAGYVVTIAGREVGRGTATTSPPTGGFPMPDFGQTARTVFVTAHVTHNHEGGPWDPTTPIQYRPPPALTGTTPPAQTTAPGSEGPPPIAEDPPGERRAADDPGARARQPSTPNPKNAAGRAPARQVEGVPVRHRGASVKHVEEVPRPQVTSAEAATRQAVSQQPVRARVGQASSAETERRHAPREASPVPTSPPPHPERLTDMVPLTRSDRDVVGGGAGIPGAVLSALSVLIVLGLAAVAIAALRGRGSPPGERLAAGGAPWLPPGMGLEARSRDLLLEAELQEMIAEERLKQRDVEHRSDVRETAASARAGPR